MVSKRREIIIDLVQKADKADYPIVLANSCDRITYANQAFISFIGFSPEEIIRRNYADFIEEPNLKALKQRLSQNSKNVLVIARCKRGNKKVLTSTTLHYTNGVGDKPSYVSTYCELNEYDETSEKRKLKDKVEQIKKQLNQALEKTRGDIRNPHLRETLKKTANDLSSIITKVTEDLKRLLNP